MPSSSSTHGHSVEWSSDFEQHREYCDVQVRRRIGLVPAGGIIQTAIGTGPPAASAVLYWDLVPRRDPIHPKRKFFCMADALKEILNPSAVRKASYASPHAPDERDEAVENQLADQEALLLQHRHREVIRAIYTNCLPATKSRMRASCTMHSRRNFTPCVVKGLCLHSLAWRLGRVGPPAGRPERSRAMPGEGLSRAR